METGKEGTQAGDSRREKKQPVRKENAACLQVDESFFPAAALSVGLYIELLYRSDFKAFFWGSLELSDWITEGISI